MYRPTGLNRRSFATLQNSVHRKLGDYKYVDSVNIGHDPHCQKEKKAGHPTYHHNFQ